MSNAENEGLRDTVYDKGWEDGYNKAIIDIHEKLFALLKSIENFIREKT